jgi:hypothetical protein
MPMTSAGSRPLSQPPGIKSFSFGLNNAVRFPLSGIPPCTILHHKLTGRFSIILHPVCATTIKKTGLPGMGRLWVGNLQKIAKVKDLQGLRWAQGNDRNLSLMVCDVLEG